MRDEGKPITRRNFQTEGNSRVSKTRNSSSVLMLLNALGLSSNTTSTTLSFAYQASILRPPPARKPVRPGSTLLRHRQKTGCGWSPVFATAISAPCSSSAPFTQGSTLSSLKRDAPCRSSISSGRESHLEAAGQCDRPPRAPMPSRFPRRLMLRLRRLSSDARAARRCMPGCRMPDARP